MSVEADQPHDRQDFQRSATESGSAPRVQRRPAAIPDVPLQIEARTDIWHVGEALGERSWLRRTAWLVVLTASAMALTTWLLDAVMHPISAWLASLVLRVVAVTLVAGMVGAALGIVSGVLSVAERKAPWLAELPMLVPLALAVAGVVLQPSDLADWVSTWLAGCIAALAMVFAMRERTARLGAAPFIEAAHRRGRSWRSIALTHVLPNLAGPVLAATIRVALFATIVLTALDLLGAGPRSVRLEWPDILLLFGFGAFALALAILSLTVPVVSATADVRSAPRTLLKERPLPEGWPVLAVDHVTAMIGNKTVLKGVSLRVQAGHTLGIMGGAGSGKSMLLRVIVGSVPVFRGRICLSGLALAKDYRDRSPSERTAIQRLCPVLETSLDPCMEIGAMLKSARGCPHAGDPTLLQEHGLLAEVGLVAERIIGKRPAALSPGELQLVALALALSADPSVLLCDCVTDGLSRAEAQTLLGVLARVQRDRNLAIVFVSDDREALAHFAQDLLVMEHGRVVNQGSVAELLARS